MSNITKLAVNGSSLQIDAAADRSLLSVLRDDLGLTGSKFGCGEGQCGACTVLLAGQPVRSCRTPVGSVGSGEITTIEGLSQQGRLHPLQQAFHEMGALQCGYCTSGMIVSAAALLEKIPKPSDEDIVKAMNGNICRCGIYPRIIAAIKRAAAAKNEGAS
ncbi:MAG TPA: (2Fe-2S)-binding protein [Opitutaceae bacterium]|nr:(2Fe-2S)-binding protein [Opitutaceae bacterium]